MKSRAISALVFGLCFGIIFTLISLFAPHITRATCGGKQGIKLYGIDLIGKSDCVGGGTKESIGIPFSSKTKYSAPSINYAGLGIQNPSYDWRFNPSAIILNLLAYWIFGFIFFFIFSRNRSRKIS